MIIIITSALKSNVVHHIVAIGHSFEDEYFHWRTVLTCGLLFWCFVVRDVWERALLLLSFQLRMLLQCWPAACVWFLIEGFSSSAVRLRGLIWSSSNGHVKNVLSGLITDQIKCVNYVRLIALYRNIGSYFIFLLLRLRVLIKQEIPPLLGLFLYLLTGAWCCLSTGCP